VHSELDDNLTKRLLFNDHLKTPSPLFHGSPYKTAAAQFWDISVYPAWPQKLVFLQRKSKGAGNWQAVFGRGSQRSPAPINVARGARTI
jgi:hypothetical protein